MDLGLHIKGLAKLIDVTPETVINWELRNVIPQQLNYVRELIKVLKINMPASLIYKDYPYNSTTLGEKIKQKRLDLHFNQRELAKIIGVSVDTIRDWESGRIGKKPFKSSIEEIKQFLNNSMV